MKSKTKKVTKPKPKVLNSDQKLKNKINRINLINHRNQMNQIKQQIKTKEKVPLRFDDMILKHKKPLLSVAVLSLIALEMKYKGSVQSLAKAMIETYKQKLLKDQLKKGFVNLYNKVNTNPK